jgi:pilus assembly protein Flp/PilA
MLCKSRHNGQGLVEYAFIILLVALIVLAVLFIFGPTIANVFSNVNSQFANF